jgi:hypothetical protein
VSTRSKMVQLKRDLPVPTRGIVDNTYWAVGEDAGSVSIEEQTFRKKNYIDLISMPLNARVVTDHANRKERGFLNYENCTMAELEAFITTRHLDLPSEDSYNAQVDPYNAQVQTTHLKLRNTPGRQEHTRNVELRRQEHARNVEAMRPRVKKAAYIAVLQAADDASVFDMFFDLPPELRTIVYQKYYEGFPPLVLPHQPPLTLASRLLRAEALPIFYEQSSFALSFTVRIYPGQPEPPFVVSNNENDRTLMTSTDLPSAALSRISRFHLSLTHTAGTRRARNLLWYNLGSRCSGSYDIDLSGSTGQVLRDNRSSDDWGSSPFWTVRRNRLQPAIMKVLQGILDRPGARNLERDDIEALRRAVWEAMTGWTEPEVEDGSDASDA